RRLHLRRRRPRDQLGRPHLRVPPEGRRQDGRRRDQPDQREHLRPPPPPGPPRPPPDRHPRTPETSLLPGQAPADHPPPRRLKPAPEAARDAGRLGHGPGRLWPWPRRPRVRGVATKPME